MKVVHIYCSSISNHVGIMGVIQNAVADAQEYGDDELDIIVSDYSKFYKLEWGENQKEVLVQELAVNRVPELAIFMPWGKYRTILPLMFKLKLRGSQIAIWNFGFFSKQQNIQNWQGGRTPLIAKKIVTKSIRLITAKITNYYLVAGGAEINDSKLPVDKCIKITFGIPTSAILDVSLKGEAEVNRSDSKSLIYIGRGQWKQKGIDNITNYANSEKGKGWNYQFFLSNQDPECLEYFSNPRIDNVKFIDKVRGANLIPYLQSGVAFLTLNQNPIQLRSLYEALSLGLSVVIMREAYMDEIKNLLSKFSAGESISIVSLQEVNDSSFTVTRASDECRRKTRKVMQVLLSQENFGRWFSLWMMNPEKNKNFYEYVYKEIIREDSVIY